MIQNRRHYIFKNVFKIKIKVKLKPVYWNAYRFILLQKIVVWNPRNVFFFSVLCSNCNIYIYI